MNKSYLYFASLASAFFLIGCEDQPEPVPTPPTSLVASAVSTTQIDLVWSDNSSNETEFKIERKEGSGEFAVVGTTGKDVHVYSDQGLSERTAYTYRVYAVSAAHETGEYSNEASASTQGIPVLSTLAISTISTFTAISGGAITIDGGSNVTTKGVVWSTTSNPTIAITTKTVDGTGSENFVSNLSGLEWETLYHVRAYATNNAGTGYGEEITFTTIPVEITTVPVADITLISAKSGGSIAGEGGVSITARGVIWSLEPNPTVELATKTMDGTNSGDFISNITGLDWDAKYYLRAYATNSKETHYGNEVSFTTEPIVITTSPSTDITINSALSGGTFAGDGGSSIIAKGVVWDTNPNPTIELTSKTAEGTGSGNFTSSLNDLSPNNNYYARAYISSKSKTTYGQEITFTTLGTITDYDGNIYPVVRIGSQIWMALNLKTTKFNDGTAIQLVTDASIPTTAAYFWYDDTAANGNTYGALYNWFTVDPGSNGNKNVCPIGWHVPTDAEWTVMKDFLLTNGYNFDGTDTDNKLAKALATSSLWNSSSILGAVGNTDYPSFINKTGFSGIPGGNRAYDGLFNLIDEYGLWWSTTEISTPNNNTPDNGAFDALFRSMGYNETRFSRYRNPKVSGYSIRCLID